MLDGLTAEAAGSVGSEASHRCHYWPHAAYHCLSAHTPWWVSGGFLCEGRTAVRFELALLDAWIEQNTVIPNGAATVL
jgi:hypothetical protein